MIYKLDYHRSLCSLTRQFIKDKPDAKTLVYMIQCFCVGAVSLNGCRNKYIVELATSQQQYMNTTIGKIINEHFDETDVDWESLYRPLFEIGKEFQ